VVLNDKLFEKPDISDYVTETRRKLSGSKSQEIKVYFEMFREM
jgi:hypothetical protein